MLPFAIAMGILMSAPKPVVVWFGGNGAYRLTVAADGEARYDELPGWGAPPQLESRTLTLPKADVDRLLSTLKAHRVCSLERSKRLPVPEERTNRVKLDAPGLACDIQLLSNDWRTTPDGAACERALSEVAGRVVKEGTRVPHPGPIGPE